MKMRSCASGTPDVGCSNGPVTASVLPSHSTPMASARFGARVSMRVLLLRSKQVLRALARSRAPCVRRRFLQLAIADFLGHELSLEHEAGMLAGAAPALLAASPAPDADPKPDLSSPDHSSHGRSLCAGPWDHGGSGGTRVSGQGAGSARAGRGVCAAPAVRLARSMSTPAEPPSSAWGGASDRLFPGGRAAGARSTPRSSARPHTSPGSGTQRSRPGGSAGHSSVSDRPRSAARRPADGAGSARSGTLTPSGLSACRASAEPSDSDPDGGLAPSQQCASRVARVVAGLEARARPIVPAIVCPPPGSSTCSSSGRGAEPDPGPDPGPDRSRSSEPDRAAHGAPPEKPVVKQGEAGRPTIALAASSASLDNLLGLGLGLVIPAGFCFTGDLDEDVSALEALEGDLSSPPSPRSDAGFPNPIAFQDPKVAAAGRAAGGLQLAGLARAGSEPWGRLGASSGGARAASTPPRTGAGPRPGLDQGLGRVPRLALPGSAAGTPPPRAPSPWARAGPHPDAAPWTPERAGALTALEAAGRQMGSMHANMQGLGTGMGSGSAAGWEPSAAALGYVGERAARPLYRDRGLHLTARVPAGMNKNHPAVQMMRRSSKQCLCALMGGAAHHVLWRSSSRSAVQWSVPEQGHSVRACTNCTSTLVG